MGIRLVINGSNENFKNFHLSLLRSLDLAILIKVCLRMPELALESSIVSLTLIGVFVFLDYNKIHNSVITKDVIYKMRNHEIYRP